MTKPRCQGIRADGKPCQAWPTKESSFCNRHQKQDQQPKLDHGFYSRTYTGRELADLVALAGEHSLDDEIGASKVAIRRLIEYLNDHGEGLDPDEYGRLANLIFTGTNTIGRLLRTRHVLEGGTVDDLTGALAGALNALSTEWELDL